MKTIYVIYADGCPKCAEMLDIINSCNVGVSGQSLFQIDKMECEEDRAVDYAIENGINDLPSCKIGSTIIQGEKFKKNDITSAIQKFMQSR